MKNVLIAIAILLSLAEFTVADDATRKNEVQLCPEGMFFISGRCVKPAPSLKLACVSEKADQEAKRSTVTYEFTLPTKSAKKEDIRLLYHMAKKSNEIVIGFFGGFPYETKSYNNQIGEVRLTIKDTQLVITAKSHIPCYLLDNMRPQDIIHQVTETIRTENQKKDRTKAIMEEWEGYPHGR